MNGAIDGGVKVATGTVDALKSQPLALALVIINIMFLAVGGWFLHGLGSAITTERIDRNKVIAQLIETCRNGSKYP